MICIKCKKETPDQELYCRHCGVKLDITFDEITGKLGDEVFTEKEEETEAFFRWIMLLLLFVLIAGILFNKLWEHPPKVLITPGYKPEVKIQKEKRPFHRTILMPDLKTKYN